MGNPTLNSLNLYTLISFVLPLCPVQQDSSITEP
ncbi:Uncharacterised protein [Vibrio cholerae]|uniref:Uncharacterized protein n=1 Tax=Vibrio cholerae TaxID=666 RepID=A0A656ARR3_VIBCL|nr:Uncharacterised protein [Vibrio cholerae]CSD30293.1 Uncharacterised protein [Vibrio cholerae]CSI63184.1 Uncharacterised protein [Vibrio cholerae]CSI75915.1 Uncharacterised protein [Vibrio cholerae]